MYAVAYPAFYLQSLPVPVLGVLVTLQVTIQISKVVGVPLAPGVKLHRLTELFFRLVVAL